MGFHFEPESSISSDGFYQDGGDEGNTNERDMFVRKDCDPSVWWKCRTHSTILVFGESVELTPQS